MHPLLRKGTVAVGVDSMCLTGWLSVDTDVEPYRGPGYGWRHDEVKVAGVETLVAVLVQFGQYVGSDESCRAGQCTFIAGASSLWVMEAGPVPGSPPGG
jgi:hypothetical protein